MKDLWDNIKHIVFVVVCALLIKTSVVAAYMIPSSSMEDTLLVGDFLLSNQFVYGARIPMTDWRLPAVHDPERGDVIVFLYPGDGVTKYIKRCVGVPGDTIEYIDKELYVNGTRFADASQGKFIDTTRSGCQRVLPRGPGGRGSRDNFGPFVVPEGQYFMMGDNRDNSADSRFWGTVPQENIVGKAMLTHWSWSEETNPAPEVELTDPMSVPRMYVHDAIHFFSKVRWGRLFDPIS